MGGQPVGFCAPVRCLCLGLGVLVLALLAAGCSHSRGAARQAAYLSIYTPEPPAFLTGPATVLLTNTGGFSAHASVQTETFSQGEKVRSGELLGRGSKLFFAPQQAEPVQKHSRPGGFAFIWDVAERRGYVLSDALQGYAPFALSAASPQATNVVLQANPAASERFAGHPTQPAEATVQMSNGSTDRFHLLRATDLNGFPVQLSAATNAVPLVLSFSKIRLESPAAGLFAPPEGFTRYDTPQAMADELFIRRHNLNRPASERIEPLENPGTGTPPVR